MLHLVCVCHDLWVRARVRLGFSQSISWVRFRFGVRSEFSISAWVQARARARVWLWVRLKVSAQLRMMVITRVL